MEINHGTHNAYGRMKCRCEECKAFRNEYQRKLNQKVERKAKHNEYQKRYHAKRWAIDPEYREWYREKGRKSATRMRAIPEKWERVKAKSRRYSRQRRDMIQQIKLKRGCADCGYNEHPEALEFDHIESGKRFAISRIKTHSLKELMAEIERCEVVCANCHRIRTCNRRRAEAGQRANQVRNGGRKRK